jgi:hypothetical protein
MRQRSVSGLPDFQTQNPNLGKFLHGLAMEDVGVLYVHLVGLTAICYILWPFGLFSAYLVHLFPVLVCCRKRNLATLVGFNFANPRTFDYLCLPMYIVTHIFA